MKKITIFLGIASMLLIFNFCKKEISPEIARNDDPYSSFMKLPYSIQQSISNSRSQDDLTFESKLYDYSIGLDSLLRKNEFFSFLIDSVKEIDSSYIKYTDILSMYSGFKGSQQYSSVLLEGINNEISRNNVSYEPIINISNFSTLNKSYLPIIALGFDLELEDDSISDIIPGWYYTGTTKIEVGVDETKGTSSIVPILVVTIHPKDQALNNLMENITDESGVNNHILKNSNTSYPYISQYRINYRYDNSNRSEYSYENTFLLTSGGVKGGGWRNLIKKIKKQDVNKTTFSDSYYLMRLSNVAGFWIVTFEYDWYASKKPIGVYSSVYGWQFIGCRMTYSDDWYQKIFFLLNQSGSQTESTKGLITVQINP